MDAYIRMEPLSATGYSLPALICLTMSNASEIVQKHSSYRLPAHRGERIRLAPHQMSPDPKDKDAVRRWLEERPRPWAIDLFCGAGGLSLGLEEEGFSVVAAADAH